MTSSPLNRAGGRNPSRIVVCLLLPLLISGALTIQVRAQNTGGRWGGGLRGGANAPLNDFNDNRIGPGFEALVRYGLGPSISVGGAFGYEEIKSHFSPNTLGLPYDYVKLHAFPVTALAWYHALPGRGTVPYFYTGIGVMLYQRLDWRGEGLTDDGLKTSIHIPVGVGAELFTSSNLSLSLDLSYHVLDDNTETVTNGGFDSYVGIKAGAILYFGRSDDDDDDGDRLTNGEERRLGTNPSSDDTDGDGLSDGQEVYTYQSSPLLIDTDSDGLTDSDEVFKWNSNPSSEDTDADEIPDGTEVSLGTSLVNPDSDGDLLLDGEEVDLKTDPLRVDSDEDGLSDHDEVRIYGTLPLDPDTDKDDLNDGEEVMKTRTNPLMPDTDGGGVVDGLEVTRGTDPLEQLDDLLDPSLIPVAGEAMVLQGVTFAPGSAVISKSSATALENAFITLVLYADRPITIVGHTDNVGSQDTNLQLSQERAEAVKRWFVQQGIPEKRLTAVGRGGANPVASNDTREGREKNRRIEIVIGNPGR